jgi:hypothetical protein
MKPKPARVAAGNTRVGGSGTPSTQRQDRVADERFRRQIFDSRDNGSICVVLHFGTRPMSQLRAIGRHRMQPWLW